MKIVVLGAGGVGGYFGGRIAAAGGDVTFVARGRHLDALRRDGLRITSPLGDAHIAPAKAVASIDDVDAADLVLSASSCGTPRAWRRACRRSSRKARPSSRSRMACRRTTCCARTCRRMPSSVASRTIATVIAEPGVIAHSGKMQRLVFGEYEAMRGGASTPRIDAFLAACIAGGIDAERSDAIERLIWESSCSSSVCRERRRCTASRSARSGTTPHGARCCAMR